MASSDNVSDSPPRSRKVAGSFSDQSSEHFVRREGSSERLIRYKHLILHFVMDLSMRVEKCYFVLINLVFMGQ